MGARPSETRVGWDFGVKSNRSRRDITDILMQQVRNTLQVAALGVLLMVHSLAQAGDLDGYRSSFLLGPLEEKLGTTLLYLSNNWSDAEREAVRLRLLMNGDTHIDLYVRASSSTAYSHGSTVTAGGSYLSYLTELKTFTCLVAHTRIETPGRSPRDHGCPESVYELGCSGL